MKLRTIKEGRDAYLFHGTSLIAALQIVADDKLEMTDQYADQPMGVSTSRVYTTARAFATYSERVFPVVFVIDQVKVAHHHKITPYADYAPNGVGKEPRYRPKEFEENIHAHLTPLSQYIVSINIEPEHLENALKNKDWYNWMTSEYGGRLLIASSRQKLRAAMGRFINHPLLNKWVPRVKWLPGTERDGLMD